MPWLPGVTSLDGELGVDLRLGAPATALDVEARTVLTPSTSVAYHTVPHRDGGDSTHRRQGSISASLVIR